MSHYYPIDLLIYCPIDLLLYCPIDLLHYCSTPLLLYSSTALLLYSSIALLLYSSTPFCDRYRKSCSTRYTCLDHWWTRRRPLTAAHPRSDAWRWVAHHSLRRHAHTHTHTHTRTHTRTRTHAGIHKCYDISIV